MFQSKLNILSLGILLILAALGLTGGAVVAASPAAQAPTVRIVSTVLTEERLRFGGYSEPSAVVDFTGNTFIGWLKTGFEEPFQAAGVVERRNPAGQVTGRWEILAPDGHKADAITITPTGDDLLVFPVSHDLGPSPRLMRLSQAVIPDVFAPYPTGQPLGAPGAYQAPSEVAITVDYELIRRNMRADLLEILRSPEYRQIIEDKNKDAIGEVMDKRLFDQGDPRAIYAQTVWGNFVRDRSYEANVSYGCPR